MVNHSEVIKNYFEATDRDHFKKSGNVFFEGNTLYSCGHHFILAIKCKNGYLLNGDHYSNSTSTHQSITRNRASTQGYQNAIIPFSSIDAMLSTRKRGMLGQNNDNELRKIELLDVTSDTWTTENRKDKDGNPYEAQIHHLGASLIKYGGKHYISSIDPGSKQNRFFLCELTNKPLTVDEAFRDLADNLTDDEYKQYQDGIIKRQGEYFLIPFISLSGDNGITTRYLTKNAKKITQLFEIEQVLDIRPISEITLETVKKNVKRCNCTDRTDCIKTSLKRIKQVSIGKREKQYVVLLDENIFKIKVPKTAIVKDNKLFNVIKSKIIKNYDLSKGVGNKHIATETIKIPEGTFIRGTLRHIQHQMISLGKIWHRVIKNTAKRSWSASGDVD